MRKRNFRRSLICGLVAGSAALLGSGPSLAGDTVNPSAQNPVLDIEKNQDPVKSLKWLYRNDQDFRQLLDNMFANVHPLADGSPNPWQGKDMDDLYAFIERWVEFLPTTDNGLSFIREFQQLVDSNIYGEQFVQQEPGRTWTRHLANARRVTMTSPKSAKYIEDWMNDPRIHIDDYVVPEQGFGTFNEFFTRTLKQPRVVNRPEDHSVVVSPADCFIEMLPVTLTDDTLIPTKVGQRLKVTEMLANSRYAEKFIGGSALRCILTPTDYHHYHAPVTGKIVESRETVDGVLYGGVPGPAMIDNVTNFQRGYYIYETEEFGYVGMVPVGLSTIGSVVFEEPFKSIDPDTPVSVNKGDRVGHFEYGGSLVILVFEPGRFEELTVDQGSRIGAMNRR